MSKNTIIILVVILILLIVGFFLMQERDIEMDPLLEEENGEMTEEEENGEITEEEANGEETAEVREIMVSGFEFGFSPEEITVTEGERVRLVFENEGTMPHDWVIEGADIKVEIIPAGVNDVIEFTAPAAGVYETFCSVGNHRQQGMIGTLIVEEA